jgi:hypothetical protein
MAFCFVLDNMFFSVLRADLNKAAAELYLLMGVSYGDHAGFARCILITKNTDNAARNPRGFVTGFRNRQRPSFQT